MAALKCFVIMPFGDDFDPVFKAAREATAEVLPGDKIQCYWLKDLHAAGRITDDIIASLQEADLCIADLTDSNPNVMWETGYAMALGKPTILIGQRIADLPFDLKVHRVLAYDPDATDDLRRRLGEAVSQTLARYRLEPKPQGFEPMRVEGRAIAVTGSVEADPGRVRARIAAVLKPYIASGAVWYCGGAGTVDEAVLRYLVEKGERAVVVTDHPIHASEAALQLVEAGDVGLLDASVESLPRGMDGPSERDMVFCMRADLAILFWNGESPVIGRLIEYLQKNGKDVLASFI